MVLPLRAGWPYKLPGLSNTPFWLLLSFSYTPNGDKTSNPVVNRCNCLYITTNNHCFLPQDWHSPILYHASMCSYTCFCSSARLSHMEATIFDTSPKDALGF